MSLREIDKSEFRVTPGVIRKSYPLNSTTFGVFTDHCELLVNVLDKTIYYPDKNTSRDENTRTLAIFDGFETASGKDSGNDLNILRCYADQDDNDRECEVINSSTLLVNSTLSMQAAPGGKLITRNLFYSEAYPLSARLIKRRKKEVLEYFYVFYQTSSVFYIKKIIRSLKNRRALWRGDLGENIEISSEMSETVHLAAHKNASELMFIGNYHSKTPMIRLYDASFSNLLSEIELICKNHVNKLTYRKVTTTKIYKDTLYALFNYDDSSLSYSAFCVFDLSKLGEHGKIVGDFLHGYSVIENNDHLRSLAVNNKFITVFSTSGKLFLSKTDDTSFTEVETLFKTRPYSNAHMDIAGQHLLLTLDTNFYLRDLNAPEISPETTLSPKNSKIIQTTNDNHEESSPTHIPFIEETPQTSSTPRECAILPSLNNVPISQPTENSFFFPPVFLAYSMAVVIIFLVVAVIYLYFTKRKLDKEKEENNDRDVLSKCSTRQTLLSSDSDSPKSMNSNDSALQFNSFPQVPTDQNYASISRNVSRIRPTSFNTMRPISISGVPDKQEFQSYMSQTLPLRGSLRNNKNNSVPAPPVPITKRNRTESITQV